MDNNSTYIITKKERKYYVYKDENSLNVAEEDYYNIIDENLIPKDTRNNLDQKIKKDGKVIIKRGVIDVLCDIFEEGTYYVEKDRGVYYFSTNKEKLEQGKWKFFIKDNDIYKNNNTSEIIETIDEKIEKIGEGSIVKIWKEPIDRLRKKLYNIKL